MKVHMEYGGNSFSDLLRNAVTDDDRREIDYWNALSSVIVETLTLRDEKNLTQAALADLLNTRQSVISRFENLGRKPSYDFLARLSQVLGGKLGITLEADLTAKVPSRMRDRVLCLARSAGVSTHELVQGALERGLEATIREHALSDWMGSEIDLPSACLAGFAYSKVSGQEIEADRSDVRCRETRELAESAVSVDNGCEWLASVTMEAEVA